MTAAPSVLVRLRPGLHKAKLADLSALLAKPLAEIREAYAAEQEIIIVSPDARTGSGRKKISKALRHAGLEPEIVSLLGWATTYPGAMPSAPAAPDEPGATESGKPDQVESLDPPTVSDEPEPA